MLMDIAIKYEPGLKVKVTKTGEIATVETAFITATKDEVVVEYTLRFGDGSSNDYDEIDIKPVHRKVKT